MMLTYVFDCIISFYPILLPLHRKVPDTSYGLQLAKRYRSPQSFVPPTWFRELFGIDAEDEVKMLCQHSKSES